METQIYLELSYNINITLLGVIGVIGNSHLRNSAYKDILMWTSLMVYIYGFVNTAYLFFYIAYNLFVK